MFEESVFIKLIEDRIAIDVQDDIATEWQWEKIVEYVVHDLQGVIHYILDGISEEELYWFSEVFEDVVDKTQSLEFLEAVLDATERVADLDKRNSILMSVSYATGYFINDDDDTIRNHIFKLQKDRFDYYCEVRRPEFIINEKQEP